MFQNWNVERTPSTILKQENHKLEPPTSLKKKRIDSVDESNMNPFYRCSENNYFYVSNKFINLLISTL